MTTAKYSAKLPFLIEVILFIGLFLWVYQKEVVVVELRQIDTAMFVEAIENVRDYGTPWSMSNKAVRDVVPLLTMSSDEVCASDFESGTQDYKRNIFQNHAYYSVYMWSLIANFIDAKFLSVMIHIGCFVGLLWLVYRALLYFGVSSLNAAALALLVCCTPNWSYGIQGQYYFDRLFLPMGFLLALTCYSMRRREFKTFDLFKFGIIAVIVCSVQERAALITGISTTLFAVMFWKELRAGHRILLLGTGVVAVVYSVLITQTFVADAAGSNAKSYELAVLELLSGDFYFLDAALRQHLVIFFVVNSSLFFFGLWSKRLLAIAIIIMLPNIFLWAPGSASKSGWATHYHSYYFPFLVLAAAHGYSILCKKQYRWFSAPRAAALLVGVNLFLSPHPGEFGFDRKHIANHALWSAATHFITPVSSETVFLSYREELKKLIPPGARVSGPTDVFMALYQDRVLRFFPVGMDDSDYVIVTNRANGDPRRRFNTFPSYRGAEEQEDIDRCLQARLVQSGFNIENRKVIGYYSVLSKNE